VSEIELARFERDARLVLPADYRQFLLMHNGGRPVPADFMLTVDGETSPWRVHFFYGLNDPVESCSLKWNLEVTKDTRPPGTLPIASDEGGNMFYLRWDKPDAGSVHFGPTPWGGRRVHLTRICGSFTEFLEGLHEIAA
jgi:hypothetical protein